MKKLLLALLSGVLIVTIAGSSFMVFLLRPSSAAPAPALSFEYRAKWVCNTSPVPPPQTFIVDTGAAENIGLVPGEYKTDINVHNPSHSANLTIIKKFVVSIPEQQSFGRPPVTNFAKTLMLPDAAFFIDCTEILRLFPQFCPSTGAISCAVKGFVVIDQLSTSGGIIGFPSDMLDVVGEYSSESFAPTSVSSSQTCLFPGSTAPTPCVSAGTSLDVERIPASPFVL